MKTISIVLIIFGTLILFLALSNIGTAFFLIQAILGFTLIGFGCIISCLVDIRDSVRVHNTPPAPDAA
jgi:hypothetical protein